MQSTFFTFLFVCFTTSLSTAQQPVVYNLVLEGGGAKGIAYPGALMELDQLHVLDSLKNVSGTSSGAISAALLSVGYTPVEMYYINRKTQFNKFNQKGFPIIQPAIRMRNTYGFYSSKRLANTVGDAIEHKTGNRDITFAQLHDSAEKYARYKDLYVTGTSLNEQRTIVFSYLSYPNMRIVDAVRISSTLPFHFETIYMTPSGKIISHKEQTDSTLLMVDGGLMMNYPIHVFDTLCNNGPCVEYLPNPHTLGLRLDDHEAMNIEHTDHIPSTILISGFNSYMNAYYEMSFEKMNRQSMQPADWKRTISIDSKNITTKQNRLTDEEKEMLVQSGRDAVRAYFSSTVTTAE